MNSLSIHVTFTAIVPGAYPGEAKMCKKCAKIANFGFYGLNYEKKTVEDRWVHAQMRLTSIELSFDPYNIYRDGPRGVGYPAGMLRSSTNAIHFLLRGGPYNVQLAIAILLVIISVCLRKFVLICFMFRAVVRALCAFLSFSAVQLRCCSTNCFI